MLKQYYPVVFSYYYRDREKQPDIWGLAWHSQLGLGVLGVYVEHKQFHRMLTTDKAML